MPTPAVIDRVRQVRAELAETAPDAPDLESLRQQLDVVLLEPLHVTPYHGLKDRLLFAYVRLQVAHPGLAASLQALVHALEAVGL